MTTDGRRVRSVARLAGPVAVLALAGALSGAAPAPAPDGQRFALLVQGTSGDPAYAALHRGWLDRLVNVLRTTYKFDAARMTVLAEQPAAGEERATADNVRAALGRLAAAMKADDLLFVMLIGHGAGEGTEARFNLVGPDLSITEWNALLKPIPGRVAVVDATSSSFPFLSGLAAPGRIIITATSSYSQKWHTVFADAFVAALESSAADADKNGRVSLLEAFTYASRLVAQHYEKDGRLATERAVLDDTGDGVGRDATSAGPDGAVAGVTYLDVLGTPTVADPELQALLVRQRELTEQVDDLRRRRLVLPAAEFDREFERLIIELSLVSRDVRRRTGG